MQCHFQLQNQFGYCSVSVLVSDSVLVYSLILISMSRLVLNFIPCTSYFPVSNAGFLSTSISRQSFNCSFVLI